MESSLETTPGDPLPVLWKLAYRTKFRFQDRTRAHQWSNKSVVVALGALLATVCLATPLPLSIAMLRRWRMLQRMKLQPSVWFRPFRSRHSSLWSTWRVMSCSEITPRHPKSTIEKRKENLKVYHVINFHSFSYFLSTVDCVACCWIDLLMGTKSGRLWQATLKTIHKDI